MLEARLNVYERQMRLKSHLVLQLATHLRSLVDAAVTYCRYIYFCPQNVVGGNRVFIFLEVFFRALVSSDRDTKIPKYLI